PFISSSAVYWIRRIRTRATLIALMILQGPKNSKLSGPIVEIRGKTESGRVELHLIDIHQSIGTLHRYNGTMAGRECYHCKQRVEQGEEHDCWTTTETALTQDLSGDLQDAWERLRGTAVSFGDQRIYASHKSVMFSRTSCYFCVRSTRKFLEFCVF